MSVMDWTQAGGRLLPRIDVGEVEDGRSAGVVETRAPIRPGVFGSLMLTYEGCLRRMKNVTDNVCRYDPHLKM